MHILLVSATEMELGDLYSDHANVDILLTGVGAPQTTFQLARRLHQIDYDWVIQLGIAGSFSDEVALGQACLVQRDRFADLLLVDHDSVRTIYEAGLADPNAFPFEDGWLNNPYLSTLPATYPMANSLTVNTVTGEPGVNQRHAAKFGAALETMEGAALHYVCREMGIPFLQIRGVSNQVGDRNKANWKIKEALQAAHQLFHQILATTLPVLEQH